MTETDKNFDHKRDDESWEEYSWRLEQIIANQRNQLRILEEFRKDGFKSALNKSERQRIRQLEIALGSMTLRWENGKLHTTYLNNKFQELRKAVRDGDKKLAAELSVRISKKAAKQDKQPKKAKNA